jgi:hypothetical protein
MEIPKKELGKEIKKEIISITFLKDILITF